MGPALVPDSGERVESAEGRWAVARVIVLRTVLVAGVLLVLMQFVPYGWAHDNPPVVSDAPWPDAASESIARESCYSCHSNETQWPIYSYVAPMSWLVRYDVDRGRDEFNFSDWDPGDADDAIEMIEDGDMPLGRYTLIHRDAELDARERDILINALRVMSDDDEHDGSEDEHD
jgi:Haem-binding domain